MKFSKKREKEILEKYGPEYLALGKSLHQIDSTPEYMINKEAEEIDASEYWKIFNNKTT